MSKLIVELQETMGSDFAIANAAWTSTYNKEKREEKYDEPEKIASIIKMLADSGHQVPFESVVLRFWMKMPIMTDRQHMTHRIASHNGLSGRYRTMPEDWLKVPDDIKAIMEKIGTGDGELLAQSYDLKCQEMYDFYNSIIGHLKIEEKKNTITNAEFKRSREFIRGLLPVGGMIERTTIMNLVSFANYQRLRNSKHAQPEVRQIARLMLREVLKSNVCPLAMKALMDNGFLLAKPNNEFEVAKDDE